MPETSVAVAGSTGSIGTQTLEVVASESERFRVTALAATARRLDLVVEQARSVRPDVVAVVSDDPSVEARLRADLPGVEPNLMRQLIDQIRQKQPLSAVLLATTQGEDKVTLVAGISKQLQERGLSAGKWIGPVAAAVGGGGGGRPDLAQAGGKDPAKLPAALDVANKTIAEMLKA